MNDVEHSIKIKRFPTKPSDLFRQMINYIFHEHPWMLKIFQNKKTDSTERKVIFESLKVLKGSFNLTNKFSSRDLNSKLIRFENLNLQWIAGTIFC
jgi:hypothetical protein